MADFYRKRKRNAGPNKNEEKVSRGKEADARSRLGARFPSVQRMSIKLTFVGSHQQALGEETRSFGPQDGCNFAVACPGACGSGTFDLAAKISQVVAAREAACESSGVCQEKLFAGSKDICGCQLKCRIDTVFLPA